MQRSGTISNGAVISDAAFDHTELLHQLERLLNSKHFRNSKRYPLLLRYVVEETLRGRGDHLKERTIGITVFDRPNDYDTNADPIVRVTAGEVRKRLAQYYQEREHQHEVRIDLPLGSYVPHFELADAASEPALLEPLGEHSEPVSHSPKPLLDQAEPLAPVSAKRGSSSLLWVGAVVMIALLGVVALLALKFSSGHDMDSATAYVWKPFLAPGAPVHIIMGVHSLDHTGNDMPVSTTARSSNSNEHDMLSAMVRYDMVPISDIVAYSRVTDLLTRNSQPYLTRGSDETTLEEIRQSPVLLIGGLDNAWTLHLTSSLRYRFYAPDKLASEIIDSQQPNTFWRFDNMQRTTGSSRDYAIVAGYYDPSIAQNVLVIAGIGMAGTKAGAEFASSSEELKSWFTQAKPTKKNFELVLSTEIVDGQPGPPQVIASSYW